MLQMLPIALPMHSYKRAMHLITCLIKPVKEYILCIELKKLLREYITIQWIQ